MPITAEEKVALAAARRTVTRLTNKLLGSKPKPKKATAKPASKPKPKKTAAKQAAGRKTKAPPAGPKQP